MDWRFGLPILVAMASGHAADVWPEGMTSKTEPNELSELWSRPITVGKVAPSRIVVEGAEAGGRFVPRAVSIPDVAPSKTTHTAFPVGVNLLDRFETRPFGSEERVEAARSKDGLLIGCGEGTAPAGVVLEADTFHFPRAARLMLAVAGIGSGEPLRLSVGRGSDAASPPDALIGARGASLDLTPSPADDPRSGDFVISCPRGKASFRLTSVSLEPGPPASPISNTGTWLWEADAWLARPGEVETWAVASQLNRIFLQLKISNGEVADRHGVDNLVTLLGQRGISVHAVEGDPAMVTDEGLDHALRRVAAIRRYQLASRPNARLAGLQFDIEPYLLADFARDPAAIWARWAEAIKALSHSWGEPVAVVVPFWMLESDAGTAALAAARPAISSLTVMAYRTDIGQVTALSEPWLAWGTLNDVPVSVAIENGPLGVEVHRTFVRAERGSLQLRFEDGTATVSLLSEAAEAPRGGLSYAFHHETRVDPAQISFMNNTTRLAVARGELARLLVAWPSFDGLMIHALDEADRGHGGPRIPQPEARPNEPQASDPDL